MRVSPALAAQLFTALTLVFVGGLAAGCATLKTEPEVEVKATRNALAPSREQKTYALVCTNDLVQQWFRSNPEALLSLEAALENLGYAEATDPALATHEIVAELGFGMRVALQDVENPDSIRFKNVAAMVGEGRYRQILTERDDSSGSILVGPNGEVIATGGWKQMMKDTEPKDDRTPGSHDTLILRAWDVHDRADTSEKIFAWEVVVRRTNDQRKPSPEHVGILIRHAAERLAAGWTDESAGTSVTPEASSKESVASTPVPSP